MNIIFRLSMMKIWENKYLNLITKKRMDPNISIKKPSIKESILNSKTNFTQQKWFSRQRGGAFQPHHGQVTQSSQTSCETSSSIRRRSCKRPTSS